MIFSKLSVMLISQARVAAILACCIAVYPAIADSRGTDGNRFSKDEQVALDLVERTCARLKESTDSFMPLPLADVEITESNIEFRGSIVGRRFFYKLTSTHSIRIDLLTQGGQPPRVVMETRRDGQPWFFVGTDFQCELNQVRRLVYQDDGLSTRARSISTLNPDGEVVASELLEADEPELSPVAAMANAQSTISVALVDSGVNYLLPEIASGLARNKRGQLLGYDFWDMDELPFDAHIAVSPFFVQRHGTRTASLLLRDAGPGIRLVSYRYPRPDLSRMAELIAHADALGVRIIGLPLGSNRVQDWAGFERAARARPYILFVASAGNGGRDIDRLPVYPAALELENMIVVTSADDSAGLAERVNWGAKSVDYLLPAEHRPVLDFSGEQTLASGSSYAVSRMVAMAARLLQQTPDLDSQEIIAAIDHYRIPGSADGMVARGYIADPRAPGQQIAFQKSGPLNLVEQSPGSSSSSGNNNSVIDLDIIYLEPRWQQQDVGSAITEASAILGQCGVSLGEVQVYTMSGADYLKDLEIGSARTLLNAYAKQVESTAIRIVLARDTRMAIKYEAEAFGHGNTTGRPWLNGSLWINYGAPDLVTTLAHELFHILANDGSHRSDGDNLMSANTRGNNNRLTPSQCQQMRSHIKSWQ